jgi:hypothetical protein
MKYIAYSAGAIFILFGLALLFTNITPVYLPSQFKIVMGMVLFLYGIFRIVVTLFKQRRKNNDEEMD